MSDSDDRRRTFGSSYPPKIDPAVLARYPSRKPSDPADLRDYETSQLKLLQLLFRNLPDGVVGTDPAGLITEANPAALELFGRKAEELEDHPVFEHLIDEYGVPLSDVIGREIMRLRFIRNRHVYVVRPDGSRRSCTLCAGPLVEDGHILRAFGIFRDRTELESLTQVDPLTELLNERTFLERAEEQIKMARRKNEPLALAYFDLVGFKPVNDGCGHAEGDRVLMKISSRIKKAVFETDFCGRLHGDEFAVLFTRIARDDVEKAVRKLLEATTFDIDLVSKASGQMESMHISADLGIAWREGADLPEATTFRDIADKAMLASKAANKRGETSPFLINDKD